MCTRPCNDTEGQCICVFGLGCEYMDMLHSAYATVQKKKSLATLLGHLQDRLAVVTSCCVLLLLLLLLLDHA